MNQRLQRLEDLEDTITTFQEYRKKSAEALWEIDKDDLYEERDYDDVKTYGADHLDLGTRHVSNLVDYGHVIEILDGEGNGTPQKEAHARPLGGLLRDEGDEDDLKAAWDKATTRYGLDGLTMNRVREAKHEVVNTEDDQDQDDDDDEPVVPDFSLRVPAATADRLNLNGDIYRGRRVVPIDGFTESDLDEIIEETEPNTSPLDGGADGEIGSTVWKPLRGDESSDRLQEQPPSSLQFRPDDVQRIRKSHVPTDNNSDDFRATEGSDALACPEVDILSETVPDPLTKEVLEWSGGGDWSPIFLSSHPGHWTDHALPDEGWIGARADRSSIEETAEAFESADDSEVKWVLYDLGGEDRREGLPDVDLSVVDWLVIGEIHKNSDLPIHQIRRIGNSFDDGATIAVRGDFTTSLKDKPIA